MNRTDRACANGLKASKCIARDIISAEMVSSRTYFSLGVLVGNMAQGLRPEASDSELDAQIEA